MKCINKETKKQERKTRGERKGEGETRREGEEGGEGKGGIHLFKHFFLTRNMTKRTLPIKRRPKKDARTMITVLLGGGVGTGGTSQRDPSKKEVRKEE